MISYYQRNRFKFIRYMSSQSTAYSRMKKKMNYLEYLRGWVGAVGFIALGNVVQCFTAHEFLPKNVYTLEPKLVTDLSARLFGLWTLMNALIRIVYCINYTDPGMYFLAYMSFLVNFVYFILEVVIFGTADWTSGIVSPSVISGLSLLFMTAGYFMLHPTDPLHSNKGKTRNDSGGHGHYGSSHGSRNPMGDDAEVMLRRTLAKSTATSGGADMRRRRRHVQPSYEDLDNSD